MSLRRLLHCSKKLQSLSTLRAYHYDSRGRAPMGNPNEQAPPQDIFQVHYVPGNYPDATSGFRPWKKDPFVLQHMFAYETWEYKYEGQWWDLGSFAWNLSWVVVPFFFYLILLQDNEFAQTKRATKQVAYHTQNGFWHSQTYIDTPSEQIYNN